MMALIIVVPLFLVAIITGLTSWLWRAIWTGASVAAWFFLGPAWIAVPAFAIIGIAIKNSMPRVSKL
jgi:hypothetical protein